MDRTIFAAFAITLCVHVTGCRKSSVQCGPGTELRGNVCSISAVADASASLAVPSGATAAPTPSPSASAGSPSPASTKYTDPFAYCASVGTVDEIDRRYVGPKEPDVIAKRLTMAGMFTWRCADGNVMACSYGANLPCGKANASREPSAQMRTYCAEHPNEFMPAFVLGHDNLFEWTCQRGVPTIGRQHSKVDARGFVAQFWYRIDRP